MFEIIHKDKTSRARAGRLTTDHGVVETPSYVIVGTNGAVRALSPEDIPKTKTQIIIANTYHLWRSIGEAGLNDYPGLHETMEWNGPLMTDSGGFQVFSMGASREHSSGKVQKEGSEFMKGERESIVRVTDSGVYFRIDDGEEPRTEAGLARGEEEQYLDAEISMKIQEQLGADIIFAFDEPSSPHHDYDYTKTTVARTHAWAERSLEAKVSNQLLYGITQGGAFEDLRKESAEFIGKLPFDGIAIGGAFGNSFGSTTDMTIKELEWTIPFLPEFKPRHLLGIGKIEDLFYGVKAGIDTFDCVIPTREARHGALWTSTGRFDITKGIYANDDNLIDPDCGCVTCADQTVTRSELRAMFKEKNFEAGRLATLHNVYFFNDLMEQIRQSIKENRFDAFATEYLRGLANAV